MTATPEIPDGISFSDLQKHLEHVSTTPTFEGVREDDVKHICEEALADVIKKVPDPVAHKTLALMVLRNLLQWHIEQAAQVSSQDKLQAFAWAERITFAFMGLLALWGAVMMATPREQWFGCAQLWQWPAAAVIKVSDQNNPCPTVARLWTVVWQ